MEQHYFTSLMNIASTHPLLTVGFIVGGTMIASGLFLSIFVSVIGPLIGERQIERFSRHGINLAGAGASIGAPAVLMMVLFDKTGIDLHTNITAKIAMLAFLLLVVILAIYSSVSVERRYRKPQTSS